MWAFYPTVSLQSAMDKYAHLKEASVSTWKIIKSIWALNLMIQQLIVCTRLSADNKAPKREASNMGTPIVVRKRGHIRRVQFN